MTPYRPLTRRARWTIALLVMGMIVDAVAVWSGVRERSLLADIAAGRIVSPAEADASDRRQAVVGFLQGGLFTLTAAAFLAWFYRAYRNLEAIAPSAREWGQGWAIGAWFVPVLNLWRPKQIVNATWSGGGRTQEWEAAPPWLGIWWAAWLVSEFLYNISFRLSLEADAVDELKTASEVTIAADAANLLAAVGAIAVVLSVTRRQERKAAEAGVAVEEVERPLYRRRGAWATLAAVAVALAVQGALVAAVWTGALEGETVGGSSDAEGQESGLRIEDDFSEPGTWLVDSGPGFAMGYAHSQYHIQVSRPGREQHSYVQLGAPVSHLHVEIQATMQEGSDPDGYGLACWSTPAAGYYGVVFADGRYAIIRAKGANGTRTLSEGRNRKRIVQGSLSGTALRFDCRQGRRARLRLWVNGKWLASARDRRPLASFTGVGFFTSSVSGDTDVFFDDFLAHD